MNLMRGIASRLLLRCLLTLVITLQGVLASSAMARMDAAKAAAEQTVICTPSGAKTILLSRDGQTLPDANCECPCGALCSALAQGFSPQGPDGDTAPLAFSQQAMFVASGRSGNRGQRRCGQGPSPRAPPIQS